MGVRGFAVRPVVAVVAPVGRTIAGPLRGRREVAQFIPVDDQIDLGDPAGDDGDHGDAGHRAVFLEQQARGGVDGHDPVSRPAARSRWHRPPIRRTTRPAPHAGCTAVGVLPPASTPSAG